MHYPSGGGEVHAFLARPTTPPPHPLVVEVHGGPQQHIQDAYDPRVQAWVDRGFAVVMPNYRGSTGYGRAWKDAACADPGLTEIADLRAGAEYLVATGIADPRRLVLHGGSWGGYLALLAAGVQDDLWAVVIAESPLADLVAAYDDETPVLQQSDRLRFGGSPKEAPDRWAERSPLTFTGKVRASVLLVAGRYDPRCPLRQVQRYAAALAEAGVRHHLVVQDVGHQIRSDDIAIERQRLALNFADANLPGPPLTSSTADGH
ncbi:MAG: alpha/beta hydrolase family protein [Angustibacter sp.]